MAASSSCSCEVVDLALEASRDDATSELFFSKEGGGSGDLSWPPLAGISSALSNRKSLVELCDKYGVPREFEPVHPNVFGCAACETPPQGSNALCIYSDALEAGLRFPLHDFYLKLLRHYGLAPSQLVPNAWKYLAAFVQRCKDAGVEPRVSAFRYFFSLCAHKRKDQPLGWHHFKPCTGRPRLFSGALPTKFHWKTRFFFLKSPEGMPWKCPVAWGKPRKEDARTVELTNVAIDKLKLMPWVDFKDLLSRHAPPVGDRTLLQLHSTTAPIMMKAESAAASAQALDFTSLHQLHTTLEAEARAPNTFRSKKRAPSTADPSGEGDDPTWWPRRKRRCPYPGPVSVTVTPPMPQSFAISAVPPPASVTVTPPMPQSFAISAVPPPASVTVTPMPQSFAISAVPPPQGVETTPCETSFDGAWGNSEISMPPGICSSDADAVFMYDALVAIDAEKARLQDKQQATDAKAAQQIAHLQDQLQQLSAANAKFMDYVVAARAENTQLKDKYASEIAKLNQEHASEVAKLQEEHHKASTTHIEKVKSECTAEIAKLQEKHAVEVAKLQEEHHKASTAHAEKVKAECMAEITKLQEKHAAEVGKLQEEHHKASTTHAEKVKAERTAEITKLQEKHAAEVAKLKQTHDAAVTWLVEEHEVEIARVEHAAEEMVQDAKKDIALTLFPDLDASLL